MVKDIALQYSLWIYGLFASMIGSSFVYLDKKKTNKETCKAVHMAVDQRLESMDGKLDKLIDMHLNGNKKS